MTAIYAFTSPSSRRAAVAADDVEYNTGKRVDKVHRVFDRYVLAVHGSDIIEHAIGAVARFFGVEDHHAPETIDELVRDLALAGKEVTPIVFPQYEKAHKKGQISEQDWQVLLANPTSLVVLDAENLRMCNVDFGYPFPPGRLKLTPTLRDLEPEMLHRFALAANVVPGPEPLDLPSIGDLPAFFARTLAADRKKEKALGSIGAMVTVDGEQCTVRSCLKNPVDFVQQHFGHGLLGFQVAIVNPLGPEDEVR